MSAPAAKLLVIDDERSVCISCQRILEEEGHTVEYLLEGRAGVERALAGDHDLVLLDLKMPDLSGMEALRTIVAERPDLGVIIITGYATIQTSIEAVKAGAIDYLPKPFTPDELSLAVTKALEDRRLRSENEYLKRAISRSNVSGEIIGRSPAMLDIFNQILKVAPSEFSVLIYGESGTGKELVAQALHQSSSRANGPFVAVDLSALTPSLIESELFGHVRGAFTGAAGKRPGYFSIARGGTLFLDEIANISLELQGKLLRVLETKRIRPVGSEREQEIELRLIAATNRPLAELVEQRSFREDLYYRLNVIPLTVPPLRERAEDIPLLTTHFLERAKIKAHPTPAIRGFTTEAMARLMAHAWPGNVRELKNIVERLVGTVDAELIGVNHLPPEISGLRRADQPCPPCPPCPSCPPSPPATTVAETSQADSQVAADAAEAAVAANVEELKQAKRRARDEAYEAIERGFVVEALRRAGGNVTRAAEQTGMLRPNFSALMRKYGIRRG